MSAARGRAAPVWVFPRPIVVGLSRIVAARHAQPAVAELEKRERRASVPTAVASRGAAT